MSKSWTWSTSDAEWGVTLDEERAVLRWWGEDKPREGVSGRELAASEREQPLSDLLNTQRPPITCPAEVLAEVLSAAAAWRPPTASTPRMPVPPVAAVTGSANLKLLPLPSLTVAQTLAACRTAIVELTGDPTPLELTRREISEQSFPDDRPTQSCATEYISELRLGERVTFRYRAFVGGWSQGEYTWKTDDFAGTGPLCMTFDSFSTEFEGAPDVISRLSDLLSAR